jgi:hypothetical protein
MDLIRRVHEAKGHPLDKMLEEIFAHFSAINTARDALVHWTVSPRKSEDGEVSNWLTVPPHLAAAFVHLGRRRRIRVHVRQLAELQLVVGGVVGAQVVEREALGVTTPAAMPPSSAAAMPT